MCGAAPQRLSRCTPPMVRSDYYGSDLLITETNYGLDLSDLRIAIMTAYPLKYFSAVVCNDCKRKVCLRTYGLDLSDLRIVITTVFQQMLRQVKSVTVTAAPPENIFFLSRRDVHSTCLMTHRGFLSSASTYQAVSTRSPSTGPSSGPSFSLLP